MRFGREKKLTPHQRREAIERVSAGEAVAEVARTFGVDRATTVALAKPEQLRQPRHVDGDPLGLIAIRDRLYRERKRRHHDVSPFGASFLADIARWSSTMSLASLMRPSSL